MKKENLYKIINQMNNSFFICAKSIQDAIEKYNKIVEGEPNYIKTIKFIEYFDCVYVEE